MNEDLEKRVNQVLSILSNTLGNSESLGYHWSYLLILSDKCNH